MPDYVRIAEGFPHQRLVVIPTNVLQRCNSLPLVKLLYITHLGTYPYAPGHYVHRDGTEQIIMIYCLKGSGTVKMDNTILNLQKGHVVFIPSDTPHVYYSDESSPWSIFWIHFSGAQKDLALNSLNFSRQNPLLFVPDTTLMQNAFEDIYACLNYHYSDAGLLAMTSAFIHLLSLIKLHYGAPKKDKQAIEDRVMGTIDFMQAHLDMQLTLKELADRAGLSVPHYSKLFRQRTSQSPVAYFIQLKIKKACELLHETAEPIHRIGLQLGYEDPYFFSRQFKKIQGISPSEFRKLTGRSNRPAGNRTDS
ncbi:helix-turn-helix domain-containing protein [Verrucomicrobia bacterium S94]|nr:helix-turn-helix domain-containing protein [Verrucomicrobia bacterium S94]